MMEAIFTWSLRAEIGAGIGSAWRFLADHPLSVFTGGLVTYVSYGWIVYYGVASDNTSITLQRRRRAYFRPITAPLSFLLTVIGFGSSMMDDLADSIRDGRTVVWDQALDALALFLKESGLEKEFEKTLASQHLLPSLICLVEIQSSIWKRREELQKKNQNEQEINELLQRGKEYMKHATAVYGTDMMASTELAVHGHVLMPMTKISDAKDHEAILAHIGLLASDNNQQRKDSNMKPEIWTDYHRDPTDATLQHAQHAMVICQHHPTKQVVVTIRGTFSLSGVVTDLAGFCEEYCGGQAHSGMAMAAYETWQTLWDPILRKKMEQLPKDYRLIITGHSLGAGVASLLQILIYHHLSQPAVVAKERLESLQGRTIECFAMAPPPVFCPLEAAEDAVRNTVAFVHHYDIVPSLSVNAIQKLMYCLSRLQAVLEVMHAGGLADFALERLQSSIVENQETNQDNKNNKVDTKLIEAYHQQVASRDVKGAPMLVIPTRQLIWLEKREAADNAEQDEKYEAHALDPALYAHRVLDLQVPDCVGNHLTSEYEVAFARVLEGPN